MLVEQRVVARIPRPDRAFDRLQPDGRTFHHPRGFAKALKPPVCEVRLCGSRTLTANRWRFSLRRRCSERFTDQRTTDHTGLLPLISDKGLEIGSASCRERMVLYG